MGGRPQGQIQSHQRKWPNDWCGWRRRRWKRRWERWRSPLSVRRERQWLGERWMVNVFETCKFLSASGQRCSGSHQAFEAASHTWLAVLKLLGLVRKVVKALSR